MIDLPVTFLTFAAGFLIVIIIGHYFATMIKSFVTIGIATAIAFYLFLADPSQKAEMDNFAKTNLEALKKMEIPFKDDILSLLNLPEDPSAYIEEASEAVETAIN